MSDRQAALTKATSKQDVAMIAYGTAAWIKRISSGSFRRRGFFDFESSSVLQHVREKNEGAKQKKLQRSPHICYPTELAMDFFFFSFSISNSATHSLICGTCT